MSVYRLLTRTAGFLLLILLTALPAGASPRPLSAAEREAVQIAVRYLAGGPSAIAGDIASDSSLAKLPRPQLLDEIERRLGPPTGATWELQTVVPALSDRMAVFEISYPSGADEVVTLDLARPSPNGPFRIRDIHFLAERSTREPLFPPAAEHAAAATAPRFSARGIALALFFAAALLMAFAALQMTRAYQVARRVGIIAIAIACGAAVFAFATSPRLRIPTSNASLVAARPQAPPSYSVLLPLRRAVAGGTGDLAAAFAHAPRVGPAGSVAQLWKAQHDLQQANADAARAALARFSSPSDVPLVEILRARAALLQNDEVASAVAYEHAVSLGPGRDGLWLEAGQAFSAMGFDDRAEQYFNRLAAIGSRDADVYYSLAAVAASKGEDDKAEERLREAWTLRPIERQSIIDAGVFWSILRRPSASFVNLTSPQEATFASQNASRTPITLPAGGVSKMSGDFLHLQIDRQELLVPGGAELAPAGTPAVDAGAWARMEEERALTDLPALLLVSRNGGAFAQPALRNRLDHTVSALANHNRWADVVALTDGVSPTSEYIPSSIFFARATALQRQQRQNEAQHLVVQLAASRLMDRKKDAQALEELGEMLASYDLYDPAVKLLDRADAIHKNPGTDDRVRQIEMNKRLATKYSTYLTPHFEIHYPEDVSETFAQQVGTILEAEWKRLQRYVPTPIWKTVVVNVVWWTDFRQTYTGSDFILGFYTGKITVPLAGVVDFVPPVVGILTHELCHAMIAQATNDQAPRWFHEGFAQRVEMRQYHENAFNMYDDDHLLAMSVIDAVIGGSPDPDMISEGYIESQTVIRFIEAKWGTKGLSTLLTAFREGATTAEALQRLTGADLATFDNEMRTWGRASKQVFENHDLVYYGNVPDEVTIRWTRPHNGGNP